MVSALLDRICVRRKSVSHFWILTFKGTLFDWLGILGLFGSLQPSSGANPILFVTQVPLPTEVNDNVVSNVFLGVGAGFGNHLGATLYAPRGGDLWLAKPNGSLTNLVLTNLTRSLGFGLAGGTAYKRRRRA